MEKIINGSRCPWNEDLEELLCNIINNRNRNFFVTGAAGVGKSLLIRRIQQYYGEYALVCASTGKAAQNIDGKTVHSNFQIDPEFKKDDEYFEKINRSAERIEPFKCIIIDEIGMLRVDVFSYVADCINRLNDKPQLIVAGDFYQLEPVVRHNQKDSLSSEYNTNSFYAFNSPHWEKLNFETVCLRKSLRHAQDIEFANCLNNLKRGINLADCIDYLNRNAFTPGKIPRMDSTTLFPRNREVRLYNNSCLNKLSGDIYRYTALVEIVEEAEIKDKDIKFKDLSVDEVLELKVGAHVMLTENNSHGGT